MHLMKADLVFMGTPDFALPTLQAVAESHRVLAVVTQPDRPAGRGRQLTASPVKRRAEKLGLTVFQPEDVNAPDAVEKIQHWNPALIVVAAFGQILRSPLLSVPPQGCVNVHASLLPRWRGAAPINAAILHNDPETGVTIMKMDEGLDSGPILSQRIIPIHRDDTAGTLFDRLAAEGARLLIDTLPAYLSGEIEPQPQDETLATYAPMLSREDGELNFQKPAEFLARKVRAYSPWPGTFTIWEGRRLIIHRAETADVTSPGVGVLTIHDGLPAVGTGKGLLVLRELQPAGSKKMAGSSFLNGNPTWGNNPLDAFR